ncbi:uncharacterized protein LOC135479276 [Liolophura sinensis]|uniref:uncharacterized protein LOC135479276 n=1 Tax=Liolophura sinensis TaxID=3198878 RepID=UPI0031588BF1
MTNRSKAVKATNPLRYLDLSFEGRQKASSEELNNGLKPHGGHRGRGKHPLSHFSFDKPRDYHEKLREDIDKLFEEEDLKVHGSPAWVCEASREVTHGGESPLIVNKFLAASRVEPPRSAQSRRSARSARNSKTPPPKKEGVLYYRPNRTHQYLTSTELKDCSQGESNIKYGRPTRTTLLRARQRSNSAPINAYEVRREMMKRAEERKSKSYLNNKQDVLNIWAGFGESQHSWLIGARYNRAHYVDAKSFSLYGMYMPRNNPMGCFATHSMASLVKDFDEFSCPSAPPDTPRSDDEGEIAPNYAQRVRSAPVVRKLHISSSPPTAKQAWSESATSDAEVTRDPETAKQNSERMPEEVATKAEGLNVKGSRLFAPRVESAKRSVLPTVQGRSWRSPRRRQTTEESMMSHPPPPTPMGLASSNQRDPTESIKLEDLITKRSYSGRGPLSDKSPSEQSKDDHRLSAPKKIKPILVDRSVNVPSVSGDSTQLGVRPQSGVGRVTGVSAETPPKVTPDKENGEKDSVRLDLERTEETALLDREVPTNSPEGTVHVTSPCSDGNESQTGNDLLVSCNPTKINHSEMIMENETQKLTNDNVVFFITEKGEAKADGENSTGSEKELQNLVDDDLEPSVEEAGMVSNRYSDGRSQKTVSAEDITVDSEKDTAEHEDDNVTTSPIIHVKVDISRNAYQ